MCEVQSMLAIRPFCMILALLILDTKQHSRDVELFDALPSSLLDPLEGLSLLNCEKLELEGRSRLPALKGVRRAC